MDFMKGGALILDRFQQAMAALMSHIILQA
jgi:hypothetical protein